MKTSASIAVVLFFGLLGGMMSQWLRPLFIKSHPGTIVLTNQGSIGISDTNIAWWADAPTNASEVYFTNNEGVTDTDPFWTNVTGARDIRAPGTVLKHVVYKWPTNQSNTFVDAPAKPKDPLIEKINLIGAAFQRTTDLALYWHNAYCEHQALSHSGPGLFNIHTEAEDNPTNWWFVCSYAAIGVSTEGNASMPFLSVTMPCGYVYELRWGDTIPSTDVPCPCGNPEHWVFRFEHAP